jgi:hypothetical protein
MAISMTADKKMVDDAEQKLMAEVDQIKRNSKEVWRS